MQKGVLNPKKSKVACVSNITLSVNPLSIKIVLFLSSSHHLFISPTLHLFFSSSLHLFISSTLHLFIFSSLHFFISSSFWHKNSIKPGMKLGLNKFMPIIITCSLYKINPFFEGQIHFLRDFFVKFWPYVQLDCAPMVSSIYFLFELTWFD